MHRSSQGSPELMGDWVYGVVACNGVSFRWEGQAHHFHMLGQVLSGLSIGCLGNESAGFMECNGVKCA